MLVVIISRKFRNESACKIIGGGMIIFFIFLAVTNPRATGIYE